VRALLNLLCWLSVAACSWLGVMFVVLHPLGFERGLTLAVLCVLQSLLVLAVSNDLVPALSWRQVALAGATGIVWRGGAAIANTLNRSHFEGFLLVIGATLILQGVLTVPRLLGQGFTRSSKVHHFGK